MGRLSRENNVRVTFGLAHSYRRPDLYRRVIGFAEAENAKGAQLRPQTSSRGIGGLFGLDHRTPFNGSAAWRELGAIPFAQRLAALEHEAFRARLLELESPPVIDLENAYILTDDDLNYVHDRSRSLAAYAESPTPGEGAALAPDRGVLHEGAYADINVIDFDNLAMELPEYKHDFPASAGRYVQRGCGYEQVIVNGQVFMEHGEHTGALAGRTLRS